MKIITLNEFSTTEFLQGFVGDVPKVLVASYRNFEFEDGEYSSIQKRNIQVISGGYPKKESSKEKATEMVGKHFSPIPFFVLERKVVVLYVGNSSDDRLFQLGITLGSYMNVALVGCGCGKPERLLNNDGKNIYLVRPSQDEPCNNTRGLSMITKKIIDNL